jgi:hypothetical protein
VSVCDDRCHWFSNAKNRPEGRLAKCWFMRKATSDEPERTMRSTLIAAAIGGVLLTIVGYLVYAAPGDAVSFGYWLGRPIRFTVWAWTLAGAAIGAGTMIAARR